MEVLVDPAFNIEVPSSPPHGPAAAYDGDRSASGDGKGEAPKSFFEDGSGFWVEGKPGFFAGDLSESSSSIGTPDDSDDVSSNKEEEEEEEEEEVQSKLKGLGSLDSLEDSLPIKRGLSSHFAGKSKSFTNLSQVSSVKELQKEENPFNKRRRVLIASKWSRRSSFYTWSNPKSMPLLPLAEDSDEAEEDLEEEKTRKVSPSPSSSSSSSSSSSPEEKKPQDEVHLGQQNRVPHSYAARMRLRLGSFKSRSLSLADLQEHDEEEGDDDD